MERTSEYRRDEDTGLGMDEVWWDGRSEVRGVRSNVEQLGKCGNGCDTEAIKVIQ